jgi:hypothetical protein
VKRGQPGGAGVGYENNPYRVIRFRNSTPFVLEPGPIAIYSGGSFVGEGISETVGSGTSATIPFAVESGIMVRRESKSTPEELELAVVLGFGVELGEFLVDLGARAGNVGPVESGSRGAPLKLGGPLQRRERQGNAGERALVGVRGALLGLDLLPQMMAAMLGVPEDVRVAALHLVGNAVEDVFEGE